MNTHCTHSSDCNEPFETCEEHSCTHKSILPFGLQEFFGVIVLAFLLILSSAGGTGGGVIIVPILMSLFQFETKSAIALSNFLVFCSCVTRYATNYRARHPQKNAVLIDYGVATVMMPVALLGSLIGVELNVTFPSAVLLIFLTFLLFFLTYQTLKKGMSLKKQEDVELKNRAQPAEQNSSNGSGMRKLESETELVTLNKQSDAVGSPQRTGSLKDIMNQIESDELVAAEQAKEQTHLQWDKLWIVLATTVVIFMGSLIRGSKKFPSILGISKCTFADATLLILILVTCGFLTRRGLYGVLK